MHDSKWKTSVRRRLLNWFDKNQRDLPWRKNKTPYRIWVSEIMLQQTQVATVIAYYKRFMKAFPSVKKLAAANEADVLKLWEGLGYYRRARQLHAAARVVVEEHGGKFPTDFESVLALPGIGRYTAGAILSISQDQQLPILEGNTIRLFARLTKLTTDPKTSANQKLLWSFSEAIVPAKRPGDFNQALMELGSEICKPKQPKCDDCPLMNLCPTFLNSLQQQIPAPSKKIKYEKLNEAVVLVPRNGKYLVRLCGEGERWEGLWDFPRFALTPDGGVNLASELKEQYGISASVQPTNDQLKHAVTKYRITLDCFRAESVRGRASAKGKTLAWKTVDEINELAMSVTGRKIANRVLKDS